MDFIDKHAVGLSLDQRRTFDSFFIRNIKALVKYSSVGKVDVEDIKKAARDSEEYALTRKK